jgi:hypothetical protein
MSPLAGDNLPSAILAEEPKGWALSGADHQVCVVANPVITNEQNKTKDTKYAPHLRQLSIYPD